MDRHRGRTDGQGASATGVFKDGGIELLVVELLLVDIVAFATHLPFSEISLSLHEIVVDDVRLPVEVFGTQEPLSIVSLSLQLVVAAGVVVGLLMPPVGVLGTQLPLSIVSVSLQLVVTADVVVGAVVEGVVEAVVANRSDMGSCFRVYTHRLLIVIQI